MNIIGFDIASEVTTVAVAKANGKIVFEGKVETSGKALREIVRKVARPRQVVFEECTQAGWLWSTLEPLCDDLIVCDPRKIQRTKEHKSDVIDARVLVEQARLGGLSRVWHGGKDLQELKYAVALYETLTKESTRIKNQIRSVFRGRGVGDGQRAYDKATRKRALAELPAGPIRVSATRLSAVLDSISVERGAALKDLVKVARRQKLYKLLRTVDGIGPIFGAILIAEIGDPHRFRTRRQLWAYAGLAVATFDSSEYEIVNGKVVRKARKPRTRGLVRAYNRRLKYVFKQAAKIVSRGSWSLYYEPLLTRSKNANNAQLTIARKLSAIVLRIAKTGERYDVTKAFKLQ
jgi:transposase